MSELRMLQAMLRAEKPKFMAMRALEKALPDKRQLVVRVTTLLLNAAHTERAFLWLTGRSLHLAAQIVELQQKLDTLKQEYAEECALRRQLTERLLMYMEQERHAQDTHGQGVRHHA